jgi:tetratricopeptide (TPR) repeat protein
MKRPLSILLLIGLMAGQIGCARFTATDNADATTHVSDRPFTEEDLYSLTLAELAGARDRPDIALNLYVQQARETRDLGVITRATLIAQYMNQHAVVDEMSSLWIQVEPANAEPRRIRAEAVAHEGKFDDAFDQGLSLLEINESTNVFEIIADKASRQPAADNTTLTARYAQALMQYPDNVSLLLGQARLLEQQGDTAAALAAVEKVLQQHPGHQVALLFAIRLQLLSGNQDGALQRLKKTSERYPDNILWQSFYTHTLYDHSLMLEQRGDIAGSERDLRAILTLQPDDADALNALGYLLADHTDHCAEAQVLITRALTQRPNDPAILDSMGWVLYRLGKHDEALPYLEKAFATTKDPEIAAHLGEVLWINGQYDAAKKVWQTGLSVKKPDTNVPNTSIQNTMRRLGAE